MKRPFILHLDNIQQFRKSFPNFNDRLKNEVSIPDPNTLNERVRILKKFLHCVPGIQLMMGVDVIWLHIMYASLYLLGVKLNNHRWYSISFDKPHFEGATNIGFQENYDALGCGVKELQTCGRFDALRNAFFVIKKFSISQELNKDSKKNKQLNLEELKKSIARIIVIVCETLRFRCVYDAVCHQHELITTTSVELMKNWSGEQTKYYSNRDAYIQTLTIAQFRDFKMASVEKALSLINADFDGSSETKMNKGTSSTASSSRQLKKSSSSSRSFVKGKGAVVEATDADYHKLVSIIDDGIQVQYAINSMKLIHDMHFSVEIAVCGVYPSLRVHQIAPAIIARAVRTSAARGTDPRSAFPEDEWPVHSAKAAINKLLMVTSEETASCSSIIESYTEPPRD